MTSVPTTRAADEEFLALLEHGLKIFGPNCTLLLRVPGAVGRFSFPPDRTWSAPKPTVQRSARTTAQGKSP